jgi:hypothetical protein
MAASRSAPNPRLKRRLVSEICSCGSPPDDCRETLFYTALVDPSSQKTALKLFLCVLGNPTVSCVLCSLLDVDLVQISAPNRPAEKPGLCGVRLGQM